jgi:hypothetical protein
LAHGFKNLTETGSPESERLAVEINAEFALCRYPFITAKTINPTKISVFNPVVLPNKIAPRKEKATAIKSL